MLVWVQVPSPAYAEVAELADAHGSGPCGSNTLRVRLPSSAPVSYTHLNGNCERSEMQDKTLADLENGLRKNRINTGFSSIYAVFKKWS